MKSAHILHVAKMYMVYWVVGQTSKNKLDVLVPAWAWQSYWVISVCVGRRSRVALRVHLVARIEDLCGGSLRDSQG